MYVCQFVTAIHTTKDGQCGNDAFNAILRFILHSETSQYALHFGRVKAYASNTMNATIIPRYPALVSPMCKKGYKRV
jgi:hypothetical protein